MEKKSDKLKKTQKTRKTSKITKTPKTAKTVKTKKTTKLNKVEKFIKENIKKIIIFTIIILTMIIGVTLAFFLVSDESDLGQLSSGYLDIDYIDGQSINVTNGLPLLKEEVDEYASKHNFTVKNIGDLQAFTEISLIIKNLPDELNSEDFRWTLYRENFPISTGSFKDVGSKLILEKSDQISPNDPIANYSIAIWIRDNGGDQNSMMNKQLDAKINVTATYRKLTDFALSEYPTLTGTSKGDTIHNLKIYGNTVDGNSVGDLVTDENDINYGKYKIGIVSRGKNVFNVNNCEIFKSWNNRSPELQIIDENNFTMNCVQGDDWQGIILNNLDKTKTYIVDLDVTLLKDYNNSNGADRIAINNYGYGNRQKIYLNEKTKLSVTVVPNNGYINIIGLYSKMKIENVMIREQSQDSVYEPYQEKIFNIYLDVPLRSNGDIKDYIDFEQSKVVRWIDSDGNILSEPIEEFVILPDITTMKGVTNIFPMTTVNPTFEGSY